MSKDDQYIKNLLRKYLEQPDSAKELFDRLQLNLIDRRNEIDKAWDDLNKIEPSLTDTPHYGKLMETVRSVQKLDTETNNMFLFIFQMLEILVMRKHEQEPKLPLTQADRTNLDWLANYFKHGLDNMDTMKL